MEVLNKQNVNITSEAEEVGGWIACVGACGTVCLVSGGVGTEFATASYFL
ncbi:hypothetical protein [Bacillus paralicheniformis]|nr:hypothetical protein [Bacillus paralicheniformis]